MIVFASNVDENEEDTIMENDTRSIKSMIDGYCNTLDFFDSIVAVVVSVDSGMFL